MTVTLEAPTRPLPRQAESPEAAVTGIALYGDLTCPWSYLASRRAALLEADGVDVEWWMVEHDHSTLETTRRDLEHVTRRLLPGERLPHALAGFVPRTRPAVSGYAEAYQSGVGPAARRLLFDAFWMHGVDLGDARVVRTLLVDTVRSGCSRSELLRDWGYAVDVTGSPVTSDAWRLLRHWRDDWSRGGRVVPALTLDGGHRLLGVDAVAWLGAEVVRRGLDPDGAVLYRMEGPRRKPVDLVDRYFASEHGNRWMQARRAALAPELFTRLRPWL